MKNLTEGNVLKNLLAYSWPVMISDMLQSLYSTIDAVWVGHLIGPNGLAAVSASMPVIFLLIGLMMGVAIATVVLVGQAYGAKNMPLLTAILENSFMTMAVMCLAVTGLSLVFSMPILKALGTPAEIIDDAHIFMIILFSGLVFTFSYQWFSGVLRGLGDSKTPLMLLIVSLILNVVLAPLLIKGFGPVPPLKIAGSALATVISQFITTLVAIIYLAKKHVILDMRKWKFKIDFKLIGRMFSLGIPMSLQMIIVSISGIVIISLVNKFGPPVIAAYGIGIRIDQFSFLPAMSLGASVSAFAAQFTGAGKPERVGEVTKYGILLAQIFALVFFIIVNLFPAQITHIFTSEHGIAEHTTAYFRIVSWTYFAFAVSFILQGILRGTGDVVPLTIIAFVVLIVLRLGIAESLVRFTPLKERGIWLGMTISVVIGVFINWWYYAQKKWMKKAVIL